MPPDLFIPKVAAQVIDTSFQRRSLGQVDLNFKPTPVNRSETPSPSFKVCRFSNLIRFLATPPYGRGVHATRRIAAQVELARKVEQITNVLHRTMPQLGIAGDADHAEGRCIDMINSFQRGELAITRQGEFPYRVEVG